MESTTQIFLEITLESGALVSGETVVGGYENRIDIESFSFSTGAKKNALKDLQGGGVTSNIDIDRVTVTKVFDRASLLLAGVLKRHEKFVEAKISVDQQYIDPEWPGKERNEILIMYLKSGYIADIKMQTSEGNAAAAIKETITLSFHNCTIYYYAEDRNNKGKLGDDYRWEPVIFETERDLQGA
jgi:type VI protein secretion system component Hcp